MNKNQQFEKFLDGLKGHGQDSLIEAVKSGFKTCLEAGSLFGIEPLMPAYGRDYENINDVQKDFDEGKDFKTAGGQYINKQQLVDMGIEKIRVRFNNIEDTDMLTITAAPKEEIANVEQEVDGGLTVVTKREIKLKGGEVIPEGEKVTIKFINDGRTLEVNSPSLGRIVKLSTLNGNKNFTKFTNTPSMTTMEKWSNDGVAKTVTGHRTEPDGYGPDGSPSWLLVLGMM